MLPPPFDPPHRKRPTGEERVDALWKEITQRQLGAAIDMLENAITACPDDLWGDDTKHPPYWRLAFHTLFWLDLYLTGSIDGFEPPAPFGLEELDPAGAAPPRTYTREELLAYLRHCRAKCRATIAGLTRERVEEVSAFVWGEGASFAELLLYNLRHVQHGAAQLNLILRRRMDSAPPWVAQERSPGA